MLDPSKKFYLVYNIINVREFTIFVPGRKNEPGH
jgi:hypothetical protein